MRGYDAWKTNPPPEGDDCHACDGTGGTDTHRCRACDGTGSVEVEPYDPGDDYDPHDDYRELDW